MRPMRWCSLVLVVAAAGCVTAPSRVDLGALVKKHGPENARHELEVRIVDDPKDIQARLALAKLCEQQGRPSQAIEQLEVVARLGGPIGTRWHDEDRARLANLLVARGRVRSARGAATALDDLQRAKAYGAKVSDAELADAKLARAIARLRHVDGKERVAGLAIIAELSTLPQAQAAWRGARAKATASERGELGAWLWSIGAKRAAWEALASWHDATPPASRSEQLQTAYLLARAWWTPIDGPAPAASELVGPARCRYAGCNPWDLVQNAVSSDAIDALVLATPAKTADPEDAFAWLAITLARALRGDGAWGATFASRVDLAALSVDKFPAGGRAAFAFLTGRKHADAGDDTSTPGRYLAAALAVWRGAKVDDVRAMLGPIAETPDGAALLELAAQTATPLASPYASAVAQFVAARFGAAPNLDRATAILEGYARDPTSGDRIARDVVARFVDAAEGHAWVGALFDAIEDPARARTSWQAAVDASAEPTYVRGLAEAAARAGDPDAALLFATQAAAASGDPAPVWTAVAHALHANGSHVHALEAARYAIDLASVDTIAPALDVAIAASEALKREQAAELRTRRAAVAPPLATIRADDPTDANAALASDNGDRMWTVARFDPRDVALRVALLAKLPATDPRRAIVVAELVSIAGDREIDRARAAIRALRKP